MNFSIYITVFSSLYATQLSVRQLILSVSAGIELHFHLNGEWNRVAISCDLLQHLVNKKGKKMFIINQIDPLSKSQLSSSGCIFDFGLLMKPNACKRCCLIVFCLTLFSRSNSLFCMLIHFGEFFSFSRCVLLCSCHFSISLCDAHTI